jgi:hypothetical protein
MLSPLAKPFQAAESAASYLQRQEAASPIGSPSSVPDYRQKVAHLDSLTEAISKFNIEDNETSHHPRTPSPLYKKSLLVPELEPPLHFGPIEPPTPTESLPPTRSAFRSDQEPVVRLTKQVWERMSQDLDTLRKQNQDLEKGLSVLKKHNEVLCNDDQDVSTQLGKLRYQNEANKTQKALMGRALAEKDMRIKEQQLEMDDLARKLGGQEEELKNLRGVLGRHGIIHGFKLY